MVMTDERMNKSLGATPAPKRITILGSTGSVGCNTLDLIERDPGSYRIEALTAHNNIDRLIEQARRLRPLLAVSANPAHFARLKQELSGLGIEVAAGPQAVIEAASRPADWVMAAIVGAAGLEPTLAAIRRGVVIGLANKETLVCAGALVMQEVRRCGAVMLPVDSEHSAIFQVFDFDRVEAVEKIILTASGGPFRSRSLSEMAVMTPAQAVAHPNWSMGAKISVDSATMMNKGLELIEAHHLFGLPESRIEILVHPQSVIHSMVAYRDGSVLAQLGSPDMRTPIAYALGWPNRISAPSARLDFAKIQQLTFEAPDETRFPALRLARAALKTGGWLPTVLNAANEVAVAAFLGDEIRFTDIAGVVEAVLARAPAGQPQSIAEVSATDAEARRLALAEVAARRRNAVA
jgi:1-deoxy-D-xylulose-5-phosphate reductoisomerase